MALKMFLVYNLFLFLIVSNSIFSQQGIKFGELAQRLDIYFAKELISDIQSQLPQGSDYSIWGWDVGDFSGDGFYDLAFTIKLAAEKRKIVQVYLFVDIEGYLVKVGQFPYQYFELPLEIGVVIRSNACFITRKNEQYNWLIRGYRFDNGSLSLLDEFTTKKEGIFTFDTYKNFQSLVNSVKYYKTNSGEVKFYAKYMTIPAYHRGRQIYKGYSADVFNNDVDFVHKGAYWWKGDDDASFTVKAVYDEQFLYMTVSINDDNVVIQNCDTCIGDHIRLWLDVLPALNDKYDRFAIKKDKKLQFRTRAEIGIFAFTIYPGDFLRKKSFVEISTTDDLETFQKIAAKNIKSVASLKDNGFVLKFKIPFSILGFDECPAKSGMTTEFGCTVVFHDFDNQYRPEEETQIATSSFSEFNAATYGSLLFIPDDIWYGESSNIYMDDIVKALIDNGF